VQEVKASRKAAEDEREARLAGEAEGKVWGGRVCIVLLL
jgi:hypothetical protein